MAAHLQRVVAIIEVLVEHVTVLDTLPVACFTAFRGYLESASGGAQSPHFRELDGMLGMKRSPSPIETAFAARMALSRCQALQEPHWMGESGGGNW